MAVTLADWLGSRSSEQLAALLQRYPEVAADPAPAHLTELAHRLATLGPRLTEWPTSALQVIQVLQVLGPRHGQRAQLASWLGCAPDDPGLTATLARLAETASVWPDGDALRMSPQLYHLFGRPLGLAAPASELLAHHSVEQLRPIARALGVPSRGRRTDLVTAIVDRLSDHKHIRELIQQAPAPTRARLTALDTGLWEDPDAPEWHPYRPADPALDWAHARGLVISDYLGAAMLPREVALALRGPDWHAPFEPYPPALLTTAVDPAQVAQEAAATASSALDQLAGVLRIIEGTPVALLKAGGVGVRELRRLTKATGLTEPALQLWLELAYRLDLITRVPQATGGGTLQPTRAYDQWQRSEPADQLAALLSAWVELPTGPLYEADPTVLSPSAHIGHLAIATRRALLDAAGDLPDDQAVPDPTGLAARVTWQFPLLFSNESVTAEVITAFWQEASLLGVVALGRRSPLGTALVSPEPTTLADTARKLLPAPAEHAVFQADLTAVVPGSPAPALAELLDATADRESGGGAVTWRFRPDSVRRALDTGWQPTELLAALTDRAVGGALPQPLTYLVHDLARRHGAIRVRPTGCVLRVPDDALAAELTGARALRPLGLALVGPGVLSSTQPVAETLAALRAAGYAPMGEDAAGEVQPPAARPARANLRSRRSSAPPRSAPTRDLLALARQLLAAPVPAHPAANPNPGAASSAPDLATLLAQRASHLTTGERRLLAHAIETQQAVMIGYTNATGRRTTRIIDSVELNGAHLVAWCHLRDDERMFALRRIEGVLPATDSDIMERS